MAAESEIDRIDPQPKVIKLSNGSAVQLHRLKTLQLFALLRILTHGGMGAGILGTLDFSLPPEEFVQRLMTMLVLSIPDAGIEALQFIQLMVEPEGRIKGRKLTKKEQDEDEGRLAAMNEHLSNPPMEDTVDIIVAVIEQEAPEFQSLGGKLARVFALFTKTGQDKDTKAADPQQVVSAAESPATP